MLKKLQKAGFSAYLVGGCIRDLLLRQAPKDFDVVTDARPQQIKKVFRNCRLIGRRFRLAHIHFEREIIEVATFRAAISDHLNKSKGGMIMRDNVYGDLFEDAWRRDFTINALYYSISDCSIIDLTGGFKDLTDKTIRLIGNPIARYQEDPVRMLRAIRFSAKLGFKLAVETKKPIIQLANNLSSIPAARLFDEIVKLYHHGQGTLSQEMLVKQGLFRYLFPQTHQLLSEQGTSKISNLIATTLKSTDTRIQQGKPITPAFLIAAFLWYPFQKHYTQLRQTDIPESAALHQAIQATLRKQTQCTTIPRRLIHVIREMWLLQFRFPKRSGKRPMQTLGHPRFRAAYDFLIILGEIGEQSPKLIHWWTDFKDAKQTKRDEMIHKLKVEHSKRDKQPSQHSND